MVRNFDIWINEKEQKKIKISIGFEDIDTFDDLRRHQQITENSIFAVDDTEIVVKENVVGVSVGFKALCHLRVFQPTEKGFMANCYNTYFGHYVDVSDSDTLEQIKNALRECISVVRKSITTYIENPTYENFTSHFKSDGDDL